MQTTVERSIDVEVPVTTAYNQWTQIEDDLTRWETEVGGVERTFTARITEQEPDRRIAWTTIDGPRQGGVVTFHELRDSETRVMYQMDFEPEGIVEKTGAAVGLVERQVESDLARFKKFIEARGTSTGEWRGEIE